MDYRRHAPAPHLTRLVEHYWSVISPAPPGPLRAVLVPNGRGTVQFCLGRPGRRYATGALLLASAYRTVGPDFPVHSRIPIVGAWISGRRKRSSTIAT